MTRCVCPSCRARDERRFWRIVRPLRPAGWFDLPPIPTWDGEPSELRLPPNRKR